MYLKAYRFYGGFKDCYEYEMVEFEKEKLNSPVIWIHNKNTYSSSAFINLNAAKTKEEEKIMKKICYELRLNYITRGVIYDE